MHDLLIVGAGPAGLTASIYASCFKLTHVLIGPSAGGQMLLAPDILNYPGFSEISGIELTQRMIEQVNARGGTIKMESVLTVEKIADGFRVKTDKNAIYEGRTLILATGVERRKLNVPGEVEYTNKGIQYCATCGKLDYVEVVAAVVGGANSAAQTASQVAHSAKKVYILYRGDALRADPVWLDHIKEHPNIEVIYNCQVTKINGDGSTLKSITLQIKNQATQQIETKDLTINRLFVEIGGVPGTALLIPLGVVMDPGGFIAVDEKLSTNVPGVFAAGDIVSHRFSIEQISSAVGSGARAATSAFSYLKQTIPPSLWGASQIKRG